MHSATRLLPAFRSCCCDAVLAGCSSTVAARLGRATTVTAPGSTGRGTSTNSSYHRPAVYSRPLRPLTSGLAPALSISVLVLSTAGHYDPRPATWCRHSVSHGVVGASGLPAGRHSTVRAWREAACHCPQDPGIQGYHSMYLLGVR